MSRSLVIGLVVTISIILGLTFFFYTSFIKEHNKSALEAVPTSAAIILEVNNLPQTWTALSGSDVWIDLKQNEAIKKLNHLFSVADSAIATNQDLAHMLTDNHIAISFHSNSAEHLSVLFVSETGSLENAEESARWIASLVKGTVTKRMFDKEVLYEIADDQRLPFLTIGLKDKLLMVSHDGSLVEDAIQRLKYHRNQDEAPLVSQKLELEGVQIGVYVRYEQLSLLLALGNKPEYKDLKRYLRVFADNSALTLSFEDANLSINGVTYTDDSLFQFLDLFKAQAPLENDLSALLPAGTALFSQLNISDYARFHSDLTEYLQNTGTLDEYTRYVDSVENLYQISITENLTPYIGPTALIGLHESAGSDYQNQVFALLQFTNTAVVEGMLKSYEKAIKQKGQADSADIIYKGYTLRHLQLGNVFKRFFGHNFEVLNSPYYVVKNNTFIFANQSSTLMFMLDELDQQQTLAASAHYQKYRASVSSSSVRFFISPGKTVSYASLFANDELLSAVSRYVYDIKKFEFAEIQYTNSSNGTFFTSVNIRFNPSFKEDTKLLWATKLDTTFDMQPAIVYNSSLRQNCILVQDVLNNLYYIHNTGTILWKTKLSGKINSKIYQVDPTRTGEIAYLFSTNKQACLITPAGNNINGFPVRFPGTASAAITLTDFYNDSTYRFFVPLESGKIMGYELSGKPVQGWNPRNIESVIRTQLSVMTMAADAYLVGSDERSKLHLLPFSSKQNPPVTAIPVLAKYPVFVFQTDTTKADIWVTDSSGQMVWYQMDNQFALLSKATVQTSSADLSHRVIQTSGGYVLLSEHHSGFTLFDAKGTKLLSKIYMDSMHTAPFFSYSKDLAPMIGYSEQNQSSLHWIDLKGNEYKMPSIAGTTPFITGDVLLNNTNFLVCGDKSNSLFLYQLK